LEFKCILIKIPSKLGNFYQDELANEAQNNAVQVLCAGFVPALQYHCVKVNNLSAGCDIMSIVVQC
jgi:hypothetical protein